MLSKYPFLFYTYRAFLININFVTQVSSNTTVYIINLFSTDKILLVSKANVAAFREKIKELGKEMGR